MVRIRFRCTLALCSAFLVLACSGGHRTKPKIDGYLATHIQEDGRKLFQFTMEIPVPERDRRGGLSGKGPAGGRFPGGGMPGGRSGGPMGGAPGGRGGMNPPKDGHASEGELEQMVESRLEREIDESGFCREGFMVIERMLRPPSPYVSGECTENASEEDRQRFPNA